MNKFFSTPSPASIAKQRLVEHQRELVAAQDRLRQAELEVSYRKPVIEDMRKLIEELI